MQDDLSELAASYGSEASSFLVLDRGAESLRARLSLIRSAQKTLDLQYYAVNNDLTSNIVIEAVIRAAERGVKVRFLIDDISVGRVYKNFLFLDGIDNIEVRIFNPISTGSQSYPARITAFFRRLRRARMRMHNKALVADNAACMTGGRNLGDEYFDTHADVSFKDIDVLALGPIAGSVAESIEAFWNADGAWPIAELYKPLKNDRYSSRARQKLQDNWDKAAKEEDGASLYLTLADYLTASGPKPVPAPAHFAYDRPCKIDDDGGPAGRRGERAMNAVRAAAEKAVGEFIIVTPYFVPDAGELGWLETLARRGVRVRVLTNSLASTDVVAVHTGYAPHRKRLLAEGLSLYELKPLGGQRRTRQRLFGRGAPSHASLHAKVYIADRKICVIGSLNFDPRSLNLNTETALVIDSAAIGENLASLFDEAAQAENSYDMRLNESGRLIYRTNRKGRMKDYRTEPDCSWWRKLQYLIFSLLPVKDEL